MKKKLLIALLVFVLLVVGLASCGDDPDVSSDGAKTVTNVEGSQDDDKDNETETETEGSISYDKKIIDNDNVKVVLVDLVEFEDELFDERGYEITFEVENKTDKTLEVQARELSADGKMIDENLQSMSQEVASGKKADAVLTISNLFSDKEAPVIEENIELILHIFDWEDYEFEEDIDVTIDLN